VLAALDPGQARGKPAELDGVILDAAEHLRACLNGDLHVLHAFNAAALIAARSALPADSDCDTSDVIRTERLRLEQAFRTLIDSRRVHVARLHLEDGAAAEVLCRVAADLAADVTVMGAISRSQLRERLLGSTAERVLDRLPCDVLVVKAADGAAPEARAATG
jgi:universal stress protein E